MNASRRLLMLLALPVAMLLAAPMVRADAVDEVKAATGKWIDAFNRKSSKDIVAQYARDAVFFGTSSPVAKRGGQWQIVNHHSSAFPAPTP